MYPVTVDQVMRVADAEQLMPPKVMNSRTTALWCTYNTQACSQLLILVFRSRSDLDHVCEVEYSVMGLLMCFACKLKRI